MSTFIIAEAGVNHNGNIDIACRMVAEAAAMGADAVKFQTFSADDLVTRTAQKAEYQKANDEASTQYEMLKKLELTADQHHILLEECRRAGIEFMSTPFSVESARLLADLGMKTWKIPSGQLTDRPMLEFVGSLNPERLIVSTGMATMAEIEAALDVLVAAGADRRRIYLLHCTTAYPTPLDEVNLRALDTLRSLDVASVGLSDHTAGTLIAAAAVARGAEVIEKHFTLDREMPGPDHKASLTPADFRAMVRDIRQVEMALGSGIKEPTPTEKTNMTAARKSIVARRNIAAGEVFTADNLTCKRPGDGISPMLIDRLIGRRAINTYQADQQIKKDELS